MAIMIPDHPPAEEVYNHSEREFWQELKEQLSDDFYVYHSLPYLRRDAMQGELDFLVVHRTYGLLNIEVKGKGVEYEDGQWYRLSRKGKRNRMNLSPTEQAKKQIESIIRGLADPARRAVKSPTGKFPLLYGWALAFPKAKKGDKALPLSLQPEVLIDSTDVCTDLEAAVIRAISFHGRQFAGGGNTLDEEDFRALRSVITPPMSLEREVDGAEVDRERRRIVELSERQSGMVRSLLWNRRIGVPGGAGTGKTVLALHAARLLAEEGKRVLLTCFNSSLANHLQALVEEWPKLVGHVDVCHFHGLCIQATKDRGVELRFPTREDPEEERKRFWREDTAFALMQALDEGKLSMGPWDALVVDEGQDFAAPWWEVLQMGFADPEVGRLAVFYDEAQAIFDHGPAIPAVDAVFPLFENFRNTRKITGTLGELVDLDMEPHREAPEGKEPRVYQQPGPAKTRRMVEGLLDELIEKERFSPSQVVILSPRSPMNSSLEGATELGAHGLVHDLEERARGVLHTTIGKFKGLQSDVVILLDIDPDDERCSPNARYVGASRAVARLYVFAKSHWLR